MDIFVHLMLFFVLGLKFIPPGVLAEGPENASVQRQKSLGDELSSILDSICEGYDKRVRPNYGGEPVVVGVTMYILSISSVSEVQMDFTVDMYFRQMWNDPRLKFSGPPGISTLSVGSEYLRRLWVPDTYFANEKMSYFHTATVLNELVRISQNGDVLRSIRLTVTASCPMDLRYFPMDRQLCTIEIESFGYTMSDIRYDWAKGPMSIGISNDVSLPQFKVIGHRQQAMAISLTTGNYSRLACEIQLVRSMGYYVIQIYIPAALIVIISWVAFWLNRTASTERVFLSVTSVLTMTTLMSSTNAALPKISYVKAVDVYLGTCFVMIFATLLQCATVGYMGKHIQMSQNSLMEKKLKERDKRKAATDNREDEEETQVVTASKDIDKLYGLTPAGLDKFSRVVFPGLFICFNLLYWIIYLRISEVVENNLVMLEN